MQSKTFILYVILGCNACDNPIRPDNRLQWINTPGFDLPLNLKLKLARLKEVELQFVHLTNLLLLPRKDYLDLEQN